MKNMHVLAISLMMLGLLLTADTRAKVLPPATQPATQPGGQAAGQPADGDELLVSKMRVQDFPAVNYYYASSQTTLTGIGNTVQEVMPKLVASFEENQVKPIGPGIFVYDGVDGTPNKEFTLEIGFPVIKGTKEAGEYKVRELPAFHCATVVFGGPVSQVHAAYMQAFAEIGAAGLKPTGEIREMYLYWEAPDSPNNLELIMIAVEK